jgi:hypothetical protein
MARSSSRAAPIEEDLPFQRKQWRVERIGWAVMILLILAALAGAFGGGGPLSSATSATPDSRVRVKHERFARVLAPMSVEITVAQPAGARSLQIRISESYMGAMSVRSIIPEPNSTALADQMVVLAFDPSSAAGDIKVRLGLEPQTIGSVKGTVVVDGGAPLRFGHFIFP